MSIVAFRYTILHPQYNSCQMRKRLVQVSFPFIILHSLIVIICLGLYRFEERMYA